MSFLYTKFLMRFMGLVALLGFFGVLYYAYQTEINYEPAGQVAPFKEAPVEKASPYYAQGDGVVNYSESHRSEREIQNWITTVVSEALFIPHLKYRDVTQGISKYFEEGGKQQYLNYLEQAKIQDYIDRSAYNLNVLVDDTPVVLNANSVNGFYRWLYRVPVTISFVPVGTNSLTAGQNNSVTQKLTLLLQLRRTDATNDPNDIVIESWKMRTRR